MCIFLPQYTSFTLPFVTSFLQTFLLCTSFFQHILLSFTHPYNLPSMCIFLSHHTAFFHSSFISFLQSFLPLSTCISQPAHTSFFRLSFTSFLPTFLLCATLYHNILLSVPSLPSSQSSFCVHLSTTTYLFLSLFLHLLLCAFLNQHLLPSCTIPSFLPSFNPPANSTAKGIKLEFNALVCLRHQSLESTCPTLLNCSRSSTVRLPGLWGL